MVRGGGGGEGEGRFYLDQARGFKGRLGSPPGQSLSAHALLVTRNVMPALFTRYTEIQGGVSCVSNVHLIIKKTVIQARKLGRGAARSQWKKPRVPREPPSSSVRPIRNRSRGPSLRPIILSILPHDLPPSIACSCREIGE